MVYLATTTIGRTPLEESKRSWGEWSGGPWSLASQEKRTMGRPFPHPEAARPGVYTASPSLARVRLLSSKSSDKNACILWRMTSSPPPPHKRAHFVGTFMNSSNWESANVYGKPWKPNGKPPENATIGIRPIACVPSCKHGARIQDPKIAPRTE